MFLTLSNDVIINIYQIASITKLITKDPYSKTFGKQFDIIMSSGTVYTCFDSIDNIATLGHAVLNYKNFTESLKKYNPFLPPNQTNEHEELCERHRKELSCGVTNKDYSITDTKENS